MAKTLCQFAGEDGPMAREPIWLPGPPREVVLTPEPTGEYRAVEGWPDRPSFRVYEWRLVTEMPRGDDWVALYQYDRRWD